MIRARNAVLLILSISLTACGGAEDEGDEVEAVAAGDTSGSMAGMEGIAGMAMGDTAMSGAMRAHMRQMEGMSGDSLIPMRDQHRQMVANMLSQMNAEMRDMGMTADAMWTATIDSVRTDLTAMPQLTAAEMQAAMPDHHRRVERLMSSHAEMMGAMGQ